MKIFKYMDNAPMLMTSSCVSAQHMFTNRHVHLSRPASAAKVVPLPTVAFHTSNKLSKRDWFEIALAYPKNDDLSTIRQYHKTTRMNKEVVESEPDSLAADYTIGIGPSTDGRREVYTLS